MSQVILKLHIFVRPLQQNVQMLVSYLQAKKILAYAISLQTPRELCLTEKISNFLEWKKEVGLGLYHTIFARLGAKFIKKGINSDRL